jgi:hypothetical protein
VIGHVTGCERCHAERSEASPQFVVSRLAQKVTAEMLRFAQHDRLAHWWVAQTPPSMSAPRTFGFDYEGAPT